MSTINQLKLGTSSSINPGVTTTFVWYPAVWDTTLHYWAVPVPPTPVGPHGSTTGRVQITKIQVTHIKSHEEPDKRYVEIDVKNTGPGPTQFDIWQSWIS